MPVPPPNPEPGIFQNTGTLLVFLVSFIAVLVAVGLAIPDPEKRQAAKAKAAALDTAERLFLARWQAWLLVHQLAPASLDPVQATAAERAAFLAVYLQNPAADAWMLARSKRRDVRAIIGNGALLPRKPVA